MGGGLNTYSYVENNPLSKTDQTGLAVGLVIACEAANAAYSVHSTNKTLKDYSESLELLEDQLARVNKEIHECPAEDTKRLGTLLEIRSDLTKTITGELGEKIAPNTLPLKDVGWGMIRAGLCGLLIVVPPF